MNIFRSFTRRSLLENRARTLVTLIGIVLSMSLFTAVTQGANSGLQYLVRVETARVGAFHGHYYNLTADEFSDARDTKGFRDTASWQLVGWAEVDSQNEYKPYLLIQSVSDNFTDLVSVDVISGRMPENENEILLPAHLASNGGLVYKIGDSISLSVGNRTSEGYTLFANNPYSPDEPEEITDAVEKKYTVVGFYTRFHYDLEDYSCPGYTALTVGQGRGEYALFFRVKQPAHFHDFMEANAINGRWRAHHDLLMYSGSLRDNGLMQVLYGFVGVLVFLIAFGSISLIYNSFSISISERTRQFGILKSVGATRKQIRASVLYEAMLLSAVAIPLGAIVGCAGIGITLWCLRDSFTFLMGSGLDVQMKLVVSPTGMIAAVVACLLTTLISAWIPARRAIHVSAIDAIRQSKDVQIRKRDVRVSWVNRTLFGFEGMLATKNFGRNRKRYRATVISLFLSVTLFISASSFCSYITGAVGGITSASGDTGADIIYYVHQRDNPDIDDTLEMLSVEGVEEAAYLQQSYAFIHMDKAALTDEYITALGRGLDYPVTVFGTSTTVCFVDDASFRQLCQSNGLDPEQFMDPTHPVGVACNRVTYEYYVSGRLRWERLNMLNAKTLPITGYEEGEKTIEGYWFDVAKKNKDGQRLYYYYPDSCWEAYMRGNWSPNDGDALILTEEEAMVRSSFTIGAVIEDREFYLPAETQFAVAYPYSMKDYVGSTTFQNQMSEVRFRFKASDHWNVYDQMYALLSGEGLSTSLLYNNAAGYEEDRMMITVINVFSFGFIVLISLIAMANVFNTISTSISLRRREFAMLKSVGLTNRGFDKMMIYECIIYGLRGLMWGLPAAFLVSYVIYRITDISYETSFYVPWFSVAIAVGSVFVVVFATMLYATRKIRRDNPIDALKNENL